MITLFTRRPAPKDAAAEAALRHAALLPRLPNPAPDPARLHRITDQALRGLRAMRPPEPDFAWLLAPRTAAILLAMTLAGGAVGLELPDPSATATPALTALLAQPITLNTP